LVLYGGSSGNDEWIKASLQSHNDFSFQKSGTNPCVVPPFMACVPPTAVASGSTRHKWLGYARAGDEEVF